MTAVQLDNLVNAVLYEGYILYPYRPSAKKNRRGRFTFGRVYPESYSESQCGAEPCRNQTECLVYSQGPARLQITVRFLQPVWREAGQIVSRNGVPSFQAAPALIINGQLHQSWQEATEREHSLDLDLSELAQSGHIESPFSFRGSRALENLPGGGAIQRRQDSLQGVLTAGVTQVAPDLFRITVQVLNQTPISAQQCEDTDLVIMRTFASTHTILRVKAGEFISLLEPPGSVRPFVAECKNIGTWPVLVGDEERQERDTLLSSPIILYDYPRVAPESAGDFYDSAEIDEMLTLRVMTMTDHEKAEMRNVDEAARRILERAEATGAEELLKLHGTMHPVRALDDFFNPTRPMDILFVNGRELRVGHSVRIHPKKRADAMDMLLDGKTAAIQAIEQDAEGRIHLALVVADDPGRDLGLARQTGHRFFYSLEEVELLEEARP